MAKIPQIVKDAASYLIELYGDNFDYLGKYEEADVYKYHFPDEICTGFPVVYLVKGNNIEEIGGFSALDILESFCLE